MDKSIRFKNNGKLKLLIIVGTRPEIIRLAAVITQSPPRLSGIKARFLPYTLLKRLGVSALSTIPKDSERPVILGEYIIEHRATVRQAASEFGISKSTVHMAVTK